MARSAAGDKVISRVRRVRAPQRVLVQPLQGSDGYAVPTYGIVNPLPREKYAFLDTTHPVYDAWVERWRLNESRAAGGDDVIDELRPFEWEVDMSDEGFYAKRQREAVYTNFPDIFTTSITGHLLRFAPKPDEGWAAPQLGKVTGKSTTPTQAEQIWYSVDNPSGAGTEWNQFWMDAVKRAAATGHRWMYVDSTSEAARSRAREYLGFRPYLVEFSPVDAPNWFINDREVLEYVVFRIPDDQNRVINGSFSGRLGQQGYLLLVREGCERLGPEFAGGGWWKFDAEKNPVDNDTWVDTMGEIPVTILYYQRHRGTPKTPAISRPGTTELGQAAVALMNMTSSANYNAWEAGGGVDYLQGIDEDAFEDVKRLKSLGTRMVPLPPNSETDAIPSVTASSAGAVQADIFQSREEAIWAAAVRLGIIEAAGQVGGSGNGSSGATAEATFGASQGPRIVWVAQNLAVAQNNILRYFELRYGHKKPTGLVNWPNKFDLVAVIDRIRSFFETERLSGIRSKTADATAMLQAAEDKGLVISPEDKEKMRQEYEANADVVLRIQAAQADAAENPTGVVGRQQSQSTQKKQADRLALQKATKSRKRGGRPGPNQPPVNRSAPGVKR